MKILKTASGKNKIKMSKKEWQGIGKKAGWWSDMTNNSPWSTERGGSPGYSQEDQDFFNSSDIVECKGCNLKMRRAYVDKAGYCKECYNAMKEDVDKGRKEDQTIGGKQHEDN